MLILRDLFTGTKRFGELKKSLAGVSQKVLTANLKDMEANGLLTRKAYPEVPPRVEYTLTETGESLKPVLGAMFDWGMDYKQKNHSPSNEQVAALGEALHGAQAVPGIPLGQGRLEEKKQKEVLLCRQNDRRAVCGYG